MKQQPHNQTFAAGAGLGGFLLGIVLCAFVFSGFLSNKASYEFNLEFDSATTIIIVMTALSIMLTSLAIIIAVVGAFGFSTLRNDAFNAAADRASEELGEDGNLRKIIDSRVDEIVARTQSGRSARHEFPNPDSEYGE